MPPEFPAAPAAQTPASHKSTFNGAPLNAPPTPEAPKAPTAKPAATPAPSEKPAERKAIEKSQEALKKAEDGARRYEEQKAAREKAERALQSERERAAQIESELRKRHEETAKQKRAEEQRALRAKHEEELAKAPADWLKKQAEELLQLKESLEEEKAARLRLENERKQEQREKLQAEAKANFIKASKDAKSYPNLSKLPDALVLAAGIQIAITEGQKGNRLADEEVLAILEDTLAEQPISTASKNPDKKSSDTNQASDTQTKKSDTPRTITSAMSKPFTRPENFDSLDDRQQRKILARLLKENSKK
jgi:hypothetical protein